MGIDSIEIQRAAISVPGFSVEHRCHRCESCHRHGFQQLCTDAADSRVYFFWRSRLPKHSIKRAGVEIWYPTKPAFLVGLTVIAMAVDNYDNDAFREELGPIDTSMLALRVSGAEVHAHASVSLHFS